MSVWLRSEDVRAALDQHNGLITAASGTGQRFWHIIDVSKAEEPNGLPCLVVSHSPVATFYKTKEITVQAGSNPPSL